MYQTIFVHPVWILWTYYLVCRSRFFLCLSLQPGPEVIKLFCCSTQLNMEFSLLTNMKMPIILGIFRYKIRQIFMLSHVWQERIYFFVSNLRFISRTNFILSWVEHEKSFITRGPGPLWMAANVISSKRWPVASRKHAYIILTPLNPTFL